MSAPPPAERAGGSIRTPTDGDLVPRGLAGTLGAVARTTARAVGGTMGKPGGAIDQRVGPRVAALGTSDAARLSTPWVGLAGSRVQVLLILVGAWAVRTYNLAGQSLWYDEGTSVTVAPRDVPT